MLGNKYEMHTLLLLFLLMGETRKPLLLSEEGKAFVFSW